MATTRAGTRPYRLWKAIPWGGLPTAIGLAALVIGAASLFPLSGLVKSLVSESHAAQLQRELLEWETKLKELEAHLAYLASLQRIEKEAEERLHMAPPQETIYVRVDVPPFSIPTLPSRYLPPATEVEEKSTPWWRKLINSLPFW